MTTATREDFIGGLRSWANFYEHQRWTTLLTNPSMLMDVDNMTDARSRIIGTARHDRLINHPVYRNFFWLPGKIGDHPIDSFSNPSNPIRFRFLAKAPQLGYGLDNTNGSNGRNDIEFNEDDIGFMPIYHDIAESYLNSIFGDKDRTIDNFDAETCPMDESHKFMKTTKIARWENCIRPKSLIVAQYGEDVYNMMREAGVALYEVKLVDVSLMMFIYLNLRYGVTATIDNVELMKPYVPKTFLIPSTSAATAGQRMLTNDQEGGRKYKFYSDEELSTLGCCFKTFDFFFSQHFMTDVDNECSCAYSSIVPITESGDGHGALIAASKQCAANLSSAVLTSAQRYVREHSDDPKVVMEVCDIMRRWFRSATRENIERNFNSELYGTICSEELPPLPPPSTPPKDPNLGVWGYIMDFVEMFKENKHIAVPTVAFGVWFLYVGANIRRHGQNTIKIG